MDPHEDPVFEYRPLIQEVINRPRDFDVERPVTNPILLRNLKYRYNMDFTHAMYILYDALEHRLKPQGFYLKNLYETEETKTREVATLEHDDYPKDYFRLYANWENNIGRFKVPVKLILNTTSVSKFERLLAEIHHLKFLTNMVRCYGRDKYGDLFTSNLKWNIDLDTNSPSKAENDRGEVSYFITLPADYEFHIVRDDPFYQIRKLLVRIAHGDNKQVIKKE